jgi:hypothetical protein
MGVWRPGGGLLAKASSSDLFLLPTHSATGLARYLHSHAHSPRHAHTCAHALHTHTHSHTGRSYGSQPLSSHTTHTKHSAHSARVCACYTAAGSACSGGASAELMVLSIAGAVYVCVCVCKGLTAPVQSCVCVRIRADMSKGQVGGTHLIQRWRPCVVCRTAPAGRPPYSPTRPAPSSGRTAVYTHTHTYTHIHAHIHAHIRA